MLVKQLQRKCWEKVCRHLNPACVFRAQGFGHSAMHFSAHICVCPYGNQPLHQHESGTHSGSADTAAILSQVFQWWHTYRKVFLNNFFLDSIWFFAQWKTGIMQKSQWNALYNCWTRYWITKIFQKKKTKNFTNWYLDLLLHQNYFLTRTLENIIITSIWNGFRLLKAFAAERD